MSERKMIGRLAMTIRAILNQKGSSDLYSIGPDATVGEAVAMLANYRIGALPVIASGKIVGIFSERDVIYGLARTGAVLLAQPISAVMTAPAITVEPDMPILSALSLMSRRRIRHLPVVDGAKTVGFVSIGDLVKFRIERIESEAAAMRDYIQTA
jgi:CBS domain-containing protein